MIILEFCVKGENGKKICLAGPNRRAILSSTGNGTSFERIRLEGKPKKVSKYLALQMFANVQLAIKSANRGSTVMLKKELSERDKIVLREFEKDTNINHMRRWRY